MNRKMKFNYWVDVLFLVTLIFAIFTGLLLWGWQRPRGAQGGGGAPPVASTPSRVASGVDRSDARAEHSVAPQMGEGTIFWGLLRGNSFWGLNKKEWENVHAWGSVAMMLFFLCHFATHFAWLVSTTKRLGERQGIDSHSSEPPVQS